MKYKLLLIAALAAMPLFASSQAFARDSREYCREYTKTIRIGGVLEVGVGQACKRGRDRSGDDIWEIVNLKGPQPATEHVRERIYDDLYRGNTRVVIIDNGYRAHRYGDYYRAPRHPHYAQRTYVYYDDHGHKKYNKHGKNKNKGHKHH